MGVEAPESLDNGKAEKFLESIPGSAKDNKELVDFQLFAKHFVETPSLWLARKSLSLNLMRLK